MVWWQQRLEPARTQTPPTTTAAGQTRGGGGAPAQRGNAPKAKAAARR
jgi:hypothetical protein